MSTADYIPSVLVGEAVTSEPGRSRYEWRNQRSFTAIKSDGSVVSWGSVSTDGDKDVFRYTQKRGPSSRCSATGTRGQPPVLTGS